MTPAPLSPETVLITGATSGIGLLTADLFAARGWHVVATGRSGPALDAWRDKHPQQLGVRLDVTDEGSVQEAVRAAVGRFGRISTLVNTAGYGQYGPLEGISSQEIDAQFRTNTLGTITVIQHVLPVMRRQGEGVIVNVTSVGGRTTAPFMSAYCASKFAIEGLSESLKNELMTHGIRVKIVEPGHFKTNFLARLEEGIHPAYQEQYENHMSWVRHGGRHAPTPEPVARAIYRAATDRSRRLRYPVRGASLLGSAKWLPWSLWSRIVAVSMKTQHA